MIVRMWKNWIAHILLVGIVKGYSHTGSLAVSYRTKPAITIQASNCTLVHLSPGNVKFILMQISVFKYS